MLAALTICNVVLIDRLEIDFRPGFCALTGETGAGKSILLDSLGLALGARSDAGLVRAGAEEACVTATFELAPGHPALCVLREAGMEAEESEPLILRRSVAADGRSRAFINDRPVSIGLLRAAGATLAEIHGQFDTQGLLDSRTHRALLDSYAGIGGRLATLWESWQQARRALDEAAARIERAQAEEEHLRRSLEDLDELDPQEGEEERLSALRGTLMRRGQIVEGMTGALGALAEAESAAGTAYRLVQKTGDGAGPVLEGIDRALAEIQEAQSQIHSRCADIEDCEDSLESIDDRLHALRGMARRYGCMPAELPARRAEIAEQLAAVRGREGALDGLRKQAEAARAAWLDEAETAHEARIKAARKLDSLVARELPPLRLEKARFETAVERLDEDKWGPSGLDRVRFLISTNPGTAPGPLDKIASGGEMARFMLALKVVLAEAGSRASLIFDEADSGIGGATASAVGERLARLARSRQVLAITHSPQVAARADHHWIVMKDGRKDVKTTVIPLAEAARREEIARMLAGAEITAEARAAADRLLETGT